MKSLFLTLASVLLAGQLASGADEYDNIANAGFLGSGDAAGIYQTRAATLEPGETPALEGMTQSIWLYHEPAGFTAGDYTITLTCLGSVPNPTVKAERSAGGLAIYTGTPTVGNAGLTLVTKLICQPNESLPEVTLKLAAGTRYYFQVCNMPGDVAVVTVVPTKDAYAVNIDFEEADVIHGSDVTYEKTTRNDLVGNIQPLPPAEPINGVAQHTVNTLWLWWTPERDGLYKINTVGSTNDTSGTAMNTTLAVFTGTGISNLVKVTENDQNVENGSIAASLTHVFREGTRYAILVGTNVPQNGAAEVRTTKLTLKEIPDTEAPEVQFTAGKDLGRVLDTGHPGTTRKYVYKGLMRDNIIAKARLVVVNELGVETPVEAGVDLGASTSKPGWRDCEWTAYLFPGQNSVRLYAVDGTGNESAKITQQAFVPGPAPVTVGMSDTSHGSVTKGFLGTTVRKLGSKITLTATPKPGYIFDGWTGSVTSSSPTITVTTGLGTDLKANFVPSPFTPLVGSYYGLLSEGTSPETNGRWALKLNGFGSFSGYTLLNGRRLVLVGTLDKNGTWTKTIRTGLKAPLDQQTLTLSQDLATGAISGTLTINGVTAKLDGRRLPVFTKKAPTPLAGTYTLALQSEDPVPNPEPPQGTGFALVTVGATGGVRVAGKTADGVPFATTAPLNDLNEAALGTVIGKGHLNGALAFGPVGSEHDIEGALSYTRLRNLAPKPNSTWVSGFTTTLTAVGSRYIAPQRGSRVLSDRDGNNGAATLALGEGAGEITAEVLVSDRNRVTEASATAVRLEIAINVKTGLITGRFVDTSVIPAVRRAVGGVILQKQQVAAGFYLSTTAEGEVISEPFLLSPR